MATIDVLDEAVFDRDLSLTEDQRNAIVEAIWSPNQAPVTNLSAFEAYSYYYIGQCRDQDRQGHAIRTHRDIVNIIVHICGNMHTTKEDLSASISATYPQFGADQNRLSNSIELAVRLWLMMCIRTRSSADEWDTTATEQPWPLSSTLPAVILAFFTTATTNYVTNKKRFSQILTAHNLKKIGGFRIESTDNLLDHLKFEGQTIFLYHHISVLKCLKGSAAKDALPDKFVDETLDSIALLFPRGNIAQDKWLQKLDPAIRDLDSPPRETDAYDYWRDRLLIIAEVLDEAQPATISQWWNDRRNKVQWYTFWVAAVVLVLTLIFGMLQTAIGIVQAWASVKGLGKS